jgi:glycosyltransferase involved in cell wall biosynthesis
MPAITTTVGLEGIDARHEQEVLIFDEPAAFAKGTVRLLQDTALQQRLAENGRLLAETRYDWQIVLKKMDAVYALAEKG